MIAADRLDSGIADMIRDRLTRAVVPAVDDPLPQQTYRSLGRIVSDRRSLSDGVSLDRLYAWPT